MSDVGQNDQDIDSRLAKLADASKAIRPRADFASRVMLAIEREQPSSWIDVVVGAARRLMPVIALTTVCTLVWDAESEDAVDDVVAESDGSVDFEW